jgi:hypothetical protein
LYAPLANDIAEVAGVHRVGWLRGSEAVADLDRIANHALAPDWR